ncbi:hypothetical protein NKG05_20610 [Oerskovia sp. M15]
MRANISLRIALRQIDAGDSRDVIEVPLAAQIPVDRPGRVVLRHGGSPPSPSSAPTPRPLPRRSSSPCSVPRWGASSPRERGDTDGAPGSPPAATTATPSDMVAALVNAARSAAMAAGLGTHAAPWLPGLPSRVTPSGLADVVPDNHELTTRLPLALSDLPDEQRRGVVAWDVGEDTSRSSVARDLGGRRPCGRSRSRHSTAGGTCTSSPRTLHSPAPTCAPSPAAGRSSTGTTPSRRTPRRPPARTTSRVTHARAARRDRGPARLARAPGRRIRDRPPGAAARRGSARGVHVAPRATRRAWVGRRTASGHASCCPRPVFPTTSRTACPHGSPDEGSGRAGCGWATRIPWCARSWWGRSRAPSRRAAQPLPRDSRPGRARPPAAPARVREHDGSPRRGPARARAVHVDAPAPLRAVPIGVGGDAAGPVHLDLTGGALVVGPGGSGRSSALLLLAGHAAAAGALRAVLSGTCGSLASQGAVRPTRAVRASSPPRSPPSRSRAPCAPSPRPDLRPVTSWSSTISTSWRRSARSRSRSSPTSSAQAWCSSPPR